MRATLPTVLDGVSFVSFYDDSFKENEENLNGQDLAYGMIADKTFGSINLSSGLRVRKGEKLKTLNSFKTVLFGTDLFSDLVLHIDENNKPLFEVLGGFSENGQILSFTVNTGLTGVMKTIMTIISDLRQAIKIFLQLHWI